MTSMISSTPAVAAGNAVTDTSRLSSQDNLKAGAEKFEAVFIGMMLKSMRATKLGTDLFDNQAMQQFRDMQDGRTAETMAATTPLGIGKALEAFLTKNRPDLSSDPATPATDARKDAAEQPLDDVK